ncbi:MAG: biotin/lipoyl-containing protein, partial [Gordonia amarae]
ALADAAANRESARVQGGLPGGWRNLASGYQTKKYAAVGGSDTDEIVVRYRQARGAYDLPDHPGVRVAEVRVVEVREGDDVGSPGFEPRPFEARSSHLNQHRGEVSLDVDGVLRALSVVRYGDSVYVDGPGIAVALRAVPRFTDPSAVQKPGSLLAPMPGSVIRIAVAEGDQVTAGQPLIWLEAMKMEHTISAPADGVVEALAVTEGQQLSVGDVLAVIAEEGADA